MTMRKYRAFDLSFDNYRQGVVEVISINNRLFIKLFFADIVYPAKNILNESVETAKQRS
jgi:hypothetical protein